MLARVLVEIKAQNLDKTFTYHVRNELENYIKKGIRIWTKRYNRSYR